MSQQCFPREPVQQFSSAGELVKEKEPNKWDKEQEGEVCWNAGEQGIWEAAVNGEAAWERSWCKGGSDWSSHSISFWNKTISGDTKIIERRKHLFFLFCHVYAFN